MCEECLAEYLAWSMYRPPAQIKLAQIGHPRWNVSHGVRVLETIRSQQELIRDFCARKHGAMVATSEGAKQ